jgi:hypothetical protein
MAAKISAPVGKTSSKAANQFADVVLVQLLLNNHILLDKRLAGYLGRKALVADGRIDPANAMDPTITAIVIFQREVMGFPSPDGRVDPGGKTLQALAGPVGQVIPPPAKPDAPKPPKAPDVTPKRLRPDSVPNQTFGGSHEVATSMGTFTIASGDVFKAVDGERLVLGVVGLDAVYLTIKRKVGNGDSGVFAQHLSGFTSDVTVGAAAADIVKRTAAIQFMMRTEMYFLAGIACSLSVAGAMFWVEMSIADWVRANRKHFPAWEKQFLALRSARATLKAHAPTLYDQLYWHVLDKVGSNLWASFASNEQQAAFRAGEVMGRLGKLNWALGASVVKALVAVLWPAVKAVALSLPGAAALGAKEMADEIQQAFLIAGRFLPKAVAEKIQSEVVGNSRVVYDAFKQLHAAFGDGGQG